MKPYNVYIIFRLVEKIHVGPAPKAPIEKTSASHCTLLPLHTSRTNPESHRIYTRIFIARCSTTVRVFRPSSCIVAHMVRIPIFSDTEII